VLTSAVLGFLVPALVAAAALALGWRGRQPAEGRGWVAALAVAAGYAAGHAAILGLPPFPPIDVTHWAFYIALAAGMLCGLPWPGGGTAGGRAALRAALALAVPLVVLWPRARHAWSLPQSALWLAGSALAIFALSAALESLVGRRGARGVPPGLTVGTALASATLLASGSALVAQLAGALAAPLGALAVGAWLWPARSALGAALPFASLFSTLLLLGFHYVEMPASSALLLALFPLSPWLVELAPLRRLPGRAQSAAATVLCGTPAAVAALIAWNARPAGGGY